MFTKIVIQIVVVLSPFDITKILYIHIYIYIYIYTWLGKTVQKTGVSPPDSIVQNTKRSSTVSKGGGFILCKDLDLI